MTNRSVPTATLIPHLIYRDYLAAALWLTRVFAFTEHFRYGDPISGGMQLHLGNAFIMISGPRLNAQSPAILGACTQYLTLIVPDVEAHYRHTQQEQATSGKSSTKPSTASANTEPTTSTATAGSSPNTPAT